MGYFKDGGNMGYVKDGGNMGLKDGGNMARNNPYVDQMLGGALQQTVPMVVMNWGQQQVSGAEQTLTVNEQSLVLRWHFSCNLWMKCHRTFGHSCAPINKFISLCDRALCILLCFVYLFSALERHHPEGLSPL